MCVCVCEYTTIFLFCVCEHISWHAYIRMCVCNFCMCAESKDLKRRTCIFLCARVRQITQICTYLQRRNCTHVC